MKNTFITISILITVFFFTQNLFAATNYVSKTGGHVSPFDSWANAATNIQAAVDVASSNDTVLVNDGTYYPGSEISLTNDVTVKSVNGAENTIVDGSNANRCFYINMGNEIDGFTITNGYSTGNGGGVFRDGGTVQNCTISGNSANDGGGLYCVRGGTVENCTITENSASGVGGGVFCNGGTVQNCTISGNSANGGGGIRFHSGTVENCTISGNSANFGGGVYFYSGSTIQNCTITGNSANFGGGVFCHKGTIINSILWNNTKGDSFSSDSINLYNCIENWTSLDNGIITNNPQLVSDTDFRLQGTSPCINAGTNMSWMIGAKDLDGNPRIDSDVVDMGAFEFQIFHVTFESDKTNGIDNLFCTFSSSVYGTNTEDIYYRWDFENDGVIDVEGTGERFPLKR